MRGKYAATLAEVARRVPCRYQTLLEYRKLPGFPKDHSPGSAKYDVVAIRQWIHDHKIAHNYGGRNGEGKVAPLNPREQALLEKKNIEIERDRFSLDRERGRYWLKADAAAVINRYAGMLWWELEKALVHELPARDEGLSAGEIAKVHRDRIRAIRANVDKILVIG
jgi:hypothetical protein